MRVPGHQTHERSVDSFRRTPELEDRRGGQNCGIGLVAGCEEREVVGEAPRGGGKLVRRVPGCGEEDGHDKSPAVALRRTAGVDRAARRTCGGFRFKVSWGFRLGARPGQADVDMGARMNAEPGSNTMSGSVIAGMDSGRARKKGREVLKARIGGLARTREVLRAERSAAGGPGGRSDRPRVAHGDPGFDSDYGEQLQHGTHMRTEPERSQAKRSMVDL